MADQWYYTEQKQRKGPVSEAQLKELASSGQLKASDMVWKQGMAQWVKASRIVSPAAPVSDPNMPPPIAPQKIKGAWFWKFVIVSGAGLLFASFLLPWWGFTTKKPESRSPEKAARVGKVFKSDLAWYESHHIYEEDLNTEALEGKDVLSRQIWGWQTGFGIVGLIVSFVVLFLAILPSFGPAMHDWSWIVSFITAILGVVTLICALEWLLGVPSEEVPPLLFQGPGIGPFLYLAASLLVFGGSITEGALNLVAFVRFRAS